MSLSPFGVGFGDDPIDYAALETEGVGPGGMPTYTPPQQWSRNLDVPIFGMAPNARQGNTPLYIAPGDPLLQKLGIGGSSAGGPQASTTPWLLIGLGVIAVMFLMGGKGRR